MTLRLFTAGLVLSSALSVSAGAQGYPPSQRASVTQNVARTEVSVTYGRPSARGRALFGQLEIGRAHV